MEILTGTPDSEFQAAIAPAVAETPASDGHSIRLDELPAKDYNEIRDAQEADKKEQGPEFLRTEEKKKAPSRYQKAINKFAKRYFEANNRAETAERERDELRAKLSGNGLAANSPAATSEAGVLSTPESAPASESQDAAPSAETSARPQAAVIQEARYQREYSEAARSIPNYAAVEAKADQINVPESLIAGIRAGVPPSEIPHLIKFLTDNPELLPALANDADPAGSVSKLARDLKAARGNGRTAPQTQRTNTTPAQTTSPEFARLQARLASHNLNVAAALKSMPEFAASVSNLQIAHHVSRAVLETDNSADVAIHLARNPKELDELNKSNAVQAAAKIGRISERLETLKNASRRERVTPPPPIRPVGGASSHSAPPLDEMPIKDFMKIRNKQERERKRGGY
jgi:hypothetical protein